MELPSVNNNKVGVEEGEIKMENIRNHGVVEDQQQDWRSKKVRSKDLYDQKLCTEDSG